MNLEGTFQDAMLAVAEQLVFTKMANAAQDAQRARMELGVLGADQDKINKAIGGLRSGPGGPAGEFAAVRKIRQSVPGIWQQFKNWPRSIWTAARQGHVDDAAAQLDILGAKNVLPFGDDFSPSTVAAAGGAALGAQHLRGVYERAQKAQERAKHLQATLSGEQSGARRAMKENLPTGTFKRWDRWRRSNRGRLKTAGIHELIRSLQNIVNQNRAANPATPGRTNEVEYLLRQHIPDRLHDRYIQHFGTATEQDAIKAMIAKLERHEARQKTRQNPPKKNPKPKNNPNPAPAPAPNPPPTPPSGNPLPGPNPKPAPAPAPNPPPLPTPGAGPAGIPPQAKGFMASLWNGIENIRSKFRNAVNPAEPEIPKKLRISSGQLNSAANSWSAGSKGAKGAKGVPVPAAKGGLLGRATLPLAAASVPLIAREWFGGGYRSGKRPAEQLVRANQEMHPKPTGGLLDRVKKTLGGS